MPDDSQLVSLQSLPESTQRAILQRIQDHMDCLVDSLRATNELLQDYKDYLEYLQQEFPDLNVPTRLGG